jgi:hypothetical protein
MDARVTPYGGSLLNAHGRLTSRRNDMTQINRIHLAVLPALVLGCASPSEPRDDSYVAGTIVARDVSISIGGAPSIHVKDATEECGVIYRITPATRVRQRGRNGGTFPVSHTILTVGKRVRVLTDLVLLSCPGQAEAEVVEIQP